MHGNEHRLLSLIVSHRHRGPYFSRFLILDLFIFHTGSFWAPPQGGWSSFVGSIHGSCLLCLIQQVLLGLMGVLVQDLEK